MGFTTRGWIETSEMTEDLKADFEMALAFAEALSNDEQQGDE